MFRTLGLATEALVMTGLSEIEDKGPHLVLRTPGEPTYWFGNAVILRDRPGDPGAAEALFRAEFPDAAHVCLQWDRPEGPDLSAFADVGFKTDRVDVLTAAGPVPRPGLPAGLVMRALQDDGDWGALHALSLDIGIEDGQDGPGHAAFLDGRIAARRRQIGQGLGGWFGVFDGDLLVAAMGLLHDARVMRFQDVQTRASHRRRGICAALLGHVQDWGLARAPDAVAVIVADTDSAAGRLYARAGFGHSETLSAAYRPGYR